MDGRQFHHGTKVTLRRSQYDSLIEIEAKAWRHDDIVFGRVDDPHALRSLHKSRGTREAAPNSMGVLRA